MKYFITALFISSMIFSQEVHIKLNQPLSKTFRVKINDNVIPLVLNSKKVKNIKITGLVITAETSIIIESPYYFFGPEAITSSHIPPLIFVRLKPTALGEIISVPWRYDLSANPTAKEEKNIIHIWQKWTDSIPNDEIYAVAE